MADSMKSPRPVGSGLLSPRPAGSGLLSPPTGGAALLGAGFRFGQQKQTQGSVRWFENKEEDGKKGSTRLSAYMSSRPSKFIGSSPQELGMALVQAATDGDLEKVDRLLLAGANVDFETEKGYTALIKACRMQRVEVVRRLLAYNPDVNRASKNGWTAMIEACRVGHQGLAEELLEKGANIDCTNVMGWTPIVEACRNRHFHVIKMLVARGSDIDHLDKDNMAPLDHTSRALKDIRAFLKGEWRKKHKDLWAREQKLRAEGKWPEAKEIPPGDQLADAANKGDLDTVKDLVENKKFNVDLTTVNGAYTPLIMACRGQHYNVVEYLLNQGADVNKHSTAGWTPCIESSRVGNLAILQLLVARGGDINKTNAFGWHGLIEACRNVNYDVVEWSIDNGSKVDHIDEDGEKAMDHTTHPWIRGLLQGGPRKILKKVLKQHKVGDPQRIPACLASIKEQIAAAIAAYDKARETGSAEAVMHPTQLVQALFEVVVQELDPLLTAAVLDLDVKWPSATAGKDEGVKEAVEFSPTNIVRAIVQLAAPSNSEWSAKRAAETAASLAKNSAAASPVLWKAEEVLQVVLERLFPELYQDEPKFEGLSDKEREAKLEDYNHHLAVVTERRSVLLNSPDSTTSRTAAVECAWKYAKEADKITGANRSDLPFVCNYFFDVMVAILRNGAKFTGQDSSGASVLHYILSTVPLLKDNKHAVAVVLKQTRQLLDEFGYDMTRQVVNAKVGLAEKTPICYLVCANPHEEREPILMMLLRMGALYPEPTDPRSKALEFEQARLMALVTQAMKDDLRGPYNSWNIMVCAVRNGDSKLVSRIMQSKLPVFMTNPELGDQAKITLPGPETDPDTGVVPVSETDVDMLVDAAIREDTDGDDYDAWRTAKKTLADTRKEQPNFSYSASMGWARVDMSGVEECLLHVAIEQEDMEDNNKEIFDLLLEYSEAEAKKITVNGTEYSYPWNEDAGENPSLTWLNSFGQNSFHVCGNKKIEGPSATNTYYFRELLKRDVHAMVTRVDVSGWAALHYASYHNKPEIVNALIETRIDLQQPTSSFMHHTPLHLAALKGNWSITLALLAAGVAVDVVDQDGCTPLTLGMLARQNLVDKGADDGSGNEEEDAAKKEDKIAQAAENELDKAATDAGDVETKIAWEEQMKDHQKGSALDREIQTYNFTIEALLNHGASIHFACEASGKDLTALMDVDEAWIAVSTKLNSIEEREKMINDEYLDKLIALEKENKTAEQRHSIIRAAKELRDRKQKVWGSVRRQIYEDKEYQVVIEQYYDNAVRKARFSKLTRFSILLLLLISVGILETTRNNHTAFYLQKTMVDALATNSGPEGGVSFGDINLNRQDFWKFAKGPFLDVIYPDKHDMFWAPFNTSLPTGVVNHYNTLIGVPRLRQIRSRTMACDVPKAFRQLPGGSLCFGNVDYEARYPFGPNGEYTWQSAYYLGTGEREGSLGSYPGSGYAVVLPGNSDDDSRERAEAALTKLEEDNWLDAATRALFLELTFYNPHENHFLLANMMIEFPLSGGAIPSWDMEVVPLRRYNTRWDASVLLLLELLVLLFTAQHGYAEFVQFVRSDLGSYWSSFYNWMDIIIVLGVPFNTLIQFLSILNSLRIDWDSRDSYVNVERQYWLGTIQTNLYSVIVFAGCLKLFDYLSVFRGLYRLIVMIEMMAKQLVSFVVILTLFLFSFTAAEYVAYGYKDETSYTVQKGMLARVFGLFSGDPVVFGHTDGDHALGTIYVMVFLISVSMVLMNLIVAVMTAAYEDAQNQSGGELAERQYEKMNSMKLTKRRTYRLVGANGEISNVIQRSEAEDLVTFLDRFDAKVYETVAHIWELFEDWNDKRRANSLQREKEMDRIAQQKKFDEASALLKGGLPEFGTADVIEYRRFNPAPSRRERAGSVYGKVKTQ